MAQKVDTHPALSNHKQVEVFDSPGQDTVNLSKSNSIVSKNAYTVARWAVAVSETNFVSCGHSFLFG